MRSSGLLNSVILTVLVVIVGMCSSQSTCPPEQSASSEAPQLTAEDMKNERTGSYGRHTYSAITKGNETVVLFTPELPRDDEQVLAAIGHIFSNELKVNTGSVRPRPVGGCFATSPAVEFTT